MLKWKVCMKFCNCYRTIVGPMVLCLYLVEPSMSIGILLDGPGVDLLLGASAKMHEAHGWLRVARQKHCDLANRTCKRSSDGT